jgi:ABC-type protease/lipase transport system fused ATPase/permease subunit
MTAALVLIGTAGALILLVVALATRRGRAEARLQMAREILHARNRQLEAANRRARNGDELARRLRAGKF